MTKRLLKDRRDRASAALAAMMAGVEADARATMEAVLENALEAASRQEVADLWDQLELCRSYWILIISGINSPEEMHIADELLRWKAFFGKDSATVLCVQTSERRQFQFCASRFGVVRTPCLILGSSPDLEEYLKFDPKLLFALGSERGAWHRLLAALHSAIERSESLDSVNITLQDVKFWRDLRVDDPSIREFSFSSAKLPTFDAFLSHNSSDKPTVRRLARALQSQGLTVWLDERQLPPGRPWQEALENVIVTARAAIVIVGPDGFGPWQDPEMRGCLTQFVQRGMPVIPVLLPGTQSKPALPLFLQAFTWVDLRRGLRKKEVNQIIWGVTGRQPSVESKEK